MSIATELTRIQQAKADIKSAIEAKGVTIPSSATIDTYDDYVAQISGGGSYDGIVKSISVNDFTGTTFNRVNTYITEVTIPSGVTSIGNNAFDSCSSLSSIDIPNSVTSIDYMAFIDCTSLTSVTIPSGVTSIGNNAFNSCSSLSSIDIPNSVTSIGRQVFQNCTSLTSVTIGSGVTSIGHNAFESCTSLTSITVDAATPPTLGNGVFDDTNNCPIYVPFASLQAYQTAWPDYYDRLLGGSSVTTGGGDSGGGSGGYSDDEDDPLIND